MCQKESWGRNRCDKGSPFHTEGPTTENALAWVVEVRAKLTKSNPCSDERSELRPLVPGVGLGMYRLSIRYPVSSGSLLVLCLLGRFKCLTSPFLSLLSLFFQLSISFHHHPVQHHLSWSSS